MAHAQLETVVRYIRRLAACDAAKDRTDRQLLQDFSVQHDQTAFACLVRRHGPMVLGVCRHVLRHVQDAEDAFQATFLVLAQNAAAIRKREALASWLHGVAYRRKGPLTVRLLPWGTLTGRLVDTSGKPQPKIRVKAWRPKMPAPGPWPPDCCGGEVETDRDGRFSLEYLDATFNRELVLSGGGQIKGSLSVVERLINLAVRPSEVRDLGDIEVDVTPVKHNGSGASNE